MKNLLELILPRLIPDISFLCISHEGKQDLEKSIPRKLRAWREHGARFVIIRDNDGGDCQALKQRLVNLCGENRRPNVLIRIACQELEAWYLGDPEAIAGAFGRDDFIKLGNKSRYRDPDAIKPSKEIAKLIPEFQKVSGARRMAAHLSREKNRSHSFHVTMDGIERLFNEMKSD